MLQSMDPVLSEARLSKLVSLSLDQLCACAGGGLRCSRTHALWLTVEQRILLGSACAILRESPYLALLSNVPTTQPLRLVWGDSRRIVV